MLILLEGIDGSGKTTQYRALSQLLDKHGYTCHKLVTPLTATRTLIEQCAPKLGSPVPRYLEVIAHTVDAIHFDRNVLRAGNAEPGIRVWDRGTLSYLAYSRALGVHDIWVDALINQLTTPDIIIYFKIRPEVAMSRLRRRQNDGVKLEPHENAAFLERVTGEYKQLLPSYPNVVTVDAEMSESEVTKSYATFVLDRVSRPPH